MDLDNSSQEPDVSLNDILKAVKEQGDINSRLRQDLSQLRQEVQGSTLSVATQVKKFETESEYKWKYEGIAYLFTLRRICLFTKQPFSLTSFGFCYRSYT
jgi:cell division septum initiation protein DivIVA